MSPLSLLPDLFCVIFSVCFGSSVVFANQYINAYNHIFKNVNLK